MEVSLRDFVKKYNVNDSISEITIVALDDDVFAEGILGVTFDDHKYVDG